MQRRDSIGTPKRETSGKLSLSLSLSHQHSFAVRASGRYAAHQVEGSNKLFMAFGVKGIHPPYLALLHTPAAAAVRPKRCTAMISSTQQPKSGSLVGDKRARLRVAAVSAAKRERERDPLFRMLSRLRGAIRQREEPYTQVRERERESRETGCLHQFYRRFPNPVRQFEG